MNLLLAAAIFLLAIAIPFRSLRHWSYGLHVAAVMAIVWLYGKQTGHNPEIFTIDAFYPVLVAHLAIINVAMVALYWHDKRSARYGGWRVPERRLHAMAFIGGSFGALLGQKLFHHKTKKSNFRVVFILTFFLHVLILMVLATLYYAG